MKTALLTGITGQDGSYLAEFLLEKGYRVAGTLRRTSCDPTGRIRHLLSRIELHEADLLDAGSLARVLEEVRPDEVYNLAAQSYVAASFRQPVLTGDVTGLGAARLLEAIRLSRRPVRVYQASSSEMFGRARESPQRETTPFHPRSPYAVAKSYAHAFAVNVREAYGMHVSCGILFNHESPRRGIEFVTRRISDGVAAIALGHAKELRLGNLEPRRDWGFAGDYVEAMWLMLQQDRPDDFVVATGESHSVREFAEEAFRHVGLDASRHLLFDPSLVRPAEVDALVGDPTKARSVLGWTAKVRFAELVHLMVDADLERRRQGPK